MKKRKRSVRVPNALLYYTVGLFIKPYFRLFYGHRIDNRVINNLKPPYLVIANHSCWLDYLISSASMFPVRMNYVGAYNFFRDRTLKFLFSLMGVISKYQYTNDLGAIKKMKQVINRGGVVALYPHGCLSNEGRPGGYAVFGIAKLAKYLGVPVVALRPMEGYPTRPRWTMHARRGKLVTEVFQVLSVEDMKVLSEDEIYRRMMAAIDFDDYRWQRENRINYKGKKLTEGVEYVLYKCPSCQAEFTLRSKDNRLYCEACGNAVRMNKQLFFEPETSETVYYDGIDNWFDFQKGVLEEEIKKTDFKLQAEPKLLWPEPGKYGYQYMGEGVVSLTLEEVTFIGTVHEKSETLVFPLKGILMVPYAAGEYIEIAKGPDIRRFIFNDLRQQIKWVMAIRQIRDRYYEQRQED